MINDDIKHYAPGAITPAEYQQRLADRIYSRKQADPPKETIIFDEYKITTVGKHYTYTRPHQIATSPLSRCRV